MFGSLRFRLLPAASGSVFMTAIVVSAAAAAVHSDALVGGSPTNAFLPTGQYITALAAPGSSYQRIRTGLRPDFNADANGAVTSALSPDGNTLLVLTSGYNCCFYTVKGRSIETPYIDPNTGSPSSRKTNNFQWVFVYDVSKGTPIKTQQIQVPNAYNGLAWDPSGTRFYFSGGQDDRIYIYTLGSGSQGWLPDAPFPILRHNSHDERPRPTYDGGILKFTEDGATFDSLGAGFGAMTAGVAIGDDRKQLFAANLQTDSLSIVETATRRAHDVRLYTPGATSPAVGEFPYWVTPYSRTPAGRTEKVYVTSLRDGQVLAVRLNGTFSVIRVGGEPGRMLLSSNKSRLYVVNPDLDEIEVIDTARDQVISRISVARPHYKYRGSMPNSLGLSPDGRTLFTTLAGENAIGVIDLAAKSIVGRIPTAWYPSSVSVSADGTRLYVLTTKSESGPNPTYDPKIPNPAFLDPYVYNLEKAGLETIPIPDSSTLAYLSALVDANNGFSNSHGTDPLMAFLQTKIKHIIYIQKENRTYDQILGDLPVGNGDPRLTEYPQPITPNFHAMAMRFEDLDNWYMSSDDSGDGWNWAEQGHANDYTNKSVPVSYAGGGFDFEWNGTVRNINLALPIFNSNPDLTDIRLTSLIDSSGNSTIEPGPKDIAATEGADDERPKQTGGYIWDSVLRAGLSYRHYGLYVDETFYSEGPGGPFEIPITRHPFEQKIIQAAPLRPAIVPYTDVYYRGWDLNVPDEYRYEEWKREFDLYVKNKNFPAFEIVVLMMDHTGDFSTNVQGLANPDTQQASNDHSVGELVDAVSHSPYWSSTAIFVLEDDSQDGPDHVDTHRSVAWVISPWVKAGAVVNTFYTDGNMLATMEDILGINHLGMNDANAAPMDDVFTTRPDMQPYDVIIPGVLCEPPVHPSLVHDCNQPKARRSRALPSLHTPQWWSQQTKGMVFDGPDLNDAAAFNRLTWRGIVGDKPYPALPTGENLAVDRARVLAVDKVPR